MSISTVPGTSTRHNYGQESGECCRYADTAIMTPQTPGPADDVPDWANIQQGKMFNQMEDKSFSEMKLFTNTKE